MSDLRDAARRAAAHLPAGRPPHEHLEALGELGLTAACLPPELGGLGEGWAGQLAVLEELARADAPLAGLVAAHVLAASACAEHAAPEQARALVPPLAQGHELAALAADEGRTGLDEGTITTRADADGRITGAKPAGTAGARARVLVVTAREGDAASAFVVRRGPAGPRVDDGRLVFEATPGERLGRPGAGLRIALRARDHGRLAAAALATGAAGAALDALPLELPGAAERVAAARALTARAAQLKDLGLPHAVEGATAERLASELARELAAVAGIDDDG